MKSTMYVDCTRGLASDMFVASLLDCCENKEQVLHELQLKIHNDMTLSADCAKSYERSGLIFKAVSNEYLNAVHNENHSHHDQLHDDDQFNEEEHLHSHEHSHCHSTLKDVHEFIDGTEFSEQVKSSAKGVYDILAKAEAEVHGAEVDTVHFHEVGQKRAVACIVCACALIEKLSPDEIVFSGINTGFGKVYCAHGEVDIPAPATKVILKDIPHFFVDTLGGELCTPTGTALAAFFADSFIPETKLDGFEKAVPDEKARVGIGLGLKDIGIANGIKITLA